MKRLQGFSPRVDSCDETVTNDDDTPHETLALLAQRILEYLNYSRSFAILIYPNDGMKRVGSSWNFGFCSLRYWRRALRADAYNLPLRSAEPVSSVFHGTLRWAIAVGKIFTRYRQRNGICCR